MAWWPRLLPGVAAAATHGVIRVGHAVRALRADGEDAVHIAELAHGLAYRAARWQPVPGAIGAPLPPSHDAGTGPAAMPPSAADALAAVPRIADLAGGVVDRLSRLGELPAWPVALASVQTPGSAAGVRSWLADVVDAATIRYLSYGRGNGVMLVHSATAPNAVLRTLPALQAELWAPSLAASWAASAALTAVYAPATPASTAGLPGPPAGSMMWNE